MTGISCEAVPHRYLVVFLCFLGMVITVGFRQSFAIVLTHINVANVSDHHSEESHASMFPHCTAPGTDKDLRVHWGETTGLLLHAAFFAGLLATSIPAGALTAYFSAKRLMGLALVFTSVLFLVLPESRRAGLWLVYIVRALQGIVEGVAVPAMNAIVSVWAKESEKARLINIAWAGVYLSPAIAGIGASITICYISWDSIMYISGSLGVVWGLVWFLTVQESPESLAIAKGEDVNHSGQEDGQQNGSSDDTAPVPWKKFFTSLPVWAIWVGAFCRNFIIAMLISEVPQYFNDSFELDISMVGVLAAVPHVCIVVFMLFGSYFFDLVVKKKWLSVTRARKLAQGSGYGVQSFCMIAIYFQNDYIAAASLLCVGAGFSGFAVSGFQTNPLDLAPHYAGPLTGISRTGTLGAVLSTILAAVLPGQYRTLHSWQLMFLIAGFIHLSGVIFYLIFASGELQPWASATSSDTNELTNQPSTKEYYDNALFTIYKPDESVDSIPPKDVEEKDGCENTNTHFTTHL